MSKTQKILLMPGDGIGVEAMAEVERVLAFFNAKRDYVADVFFWQQYVGTNDWFANFIDLVNRGQICGVVDVEQITRCGFNLVNQG